MLTKLYLPSLTNAQHIAFHHAVLTQIDDCPAEDLRLSEQLFADYRQAINRLQDCINRTVASSLTPKMKEQDELRDRYYTAVRNALKNARYCSREAVHRLWPVIEKKLLSIYPGDIADKPYQEETACINGFIMDIRNCFITSQIEALGITEDLEALTSANQTFESLYLARVSELSAYTSGETLSLRKKADHLYRLICLSIQYVSLQEDNDNDPDAADCAPAAIQYIRQLNQLIAEYKTLTSRRPNTPDSSDKPDASDKTDASDKPSDQTPEDNGNNNGNAPGAAPGDL